MSVLPPLPPAAKVWSLLPPALHKALLLGAEGTPRLLRLAHDNLSLLDNSPHRELLVRIFADMFLCAWEGSLFDPQAASALTQVQEQIRFLPPQAALFAARCAQARPGSPQAAKEAEALLAARDIPAIQNFLETQRKTDPENIFWMGFARYLGVHLHERDWYHDWLEAYTLPRGIIAAVQADYLFAGQDFSGAACLYAEAHEQMPIPDLLVRQGECLNRLGSYTDAQELWLRALKERPWQSNLIFRLTDSLLGHNRAGEHPAGRGYVLLYTWNHGADLAQTLDSLAASDLGGARVLLLNNGSTDDTAAIIQKGSERFNGKLETLDLPVNVGAPAARNWLLHDPRVQAADWAVYIDDDALVPKDWLGFLGTAHRAFPDAGIIGCRVVEKDAPLTMQSVDLHFEPIDPVQRQGNHPGNNILNGHINEADFGQYAYLRPCVSVTGCCHMFTRRSMDSVQGFDLRFSPSQFDDFERDLRSSLAGDLPVYQGHLRIRHIKRNNMVTGMTPWQQANVAGNLVKLWKTYSPEQVQTISNNDLRALQKALQARLKVLPD